MKKSIKQKGNDDVKKYIYNHYKQGKSLEELRALAALKGFDVKVSTIKSWIVDVESREEGSRAEKKHNTVLEAYRDRNAYYESISPDDYVYGEVDGRIKKVKILEKYPSFVVCKVNELYRVSINKMDIIVRSDANGK